MCRAGLYASGLRVCALILCVLGFAACGGTTTGPEGSPTPGSFAELQVEVFTPSCARSNCHNERSRAGEQILSSGQAFANLVNVPATEDPSRLRVDPGFPERSYLIAKLRGGPDLRMARMPLNSTPLSESQIRLIEQWIALGARPD